MAKPAKHEDELSRLGQQLHQAQSRVEAIRSKLDARLCYWHDAGVPIAALARASGLSRETVYKSIDRHRAKLKA